MPGSDLNAATAIQSATIVVSSLSIVFALCSFHHSVLYMDTHMAGIVNLQELLCRMSLELASDDYVFCSTAQAMTFFEALEPFAMIREAEGLTLILSQTAAKSAGLSYDGVFKRITLEVHSSLVAVGLTAIVSAKLTEIGVSANVVAGYYHDHIFVPKEQAAPAMQALAELR
ncbi:MAG: ACT domain-containing protein [Congregibacter sp.]